MESEKLEQVWRAVCDQVKSYNNIDPSQINAFFSRLQPQAMSEDFLMLTADNDFIKTWIERHYVDFIKQALMDLYRTAFTVLIEVDIAAEAAGAAQGTVASAPAASSSATMAPAGAPAAAAEGAPAGVGGYTAGSPTTSQPPSQQTAAEQPPIASQIADAYEPVGDDALGDVYQDEDEPGGPDRPTSTLTFENFVIGDSNRMAYSMAVAVADMEICEKLTPDYFASQKELLDGAAAVVVDANLPRESIAHLVEHCAAPLFVDPVSTVKAEKLQGLLSHVHTLKPNRIEAELLSGVKISDDATLHQAAQALLDQGVQRVFLSLGGDGVFAAQQGETHLEPICKAEMRNATGAGDAMMASLVWSFLAGRNLAESCAAGTAAAAIAVESEETINPNISAEAVLARAAK